MTTTRRERLRAELMADLKAAALDQLRERGPAGLSLRAVARSVGMSAAGLYRYVDGRDDLLTVLITDGYDDLADHLAVALGHGEDALSAVDRRPPEVPTVAPPGVGTRARMTAVAAAYRAWSVARPNEFGLLYGTPIEGYAAPPGGPTVEANRRVAMGLLTPMIEAWQGGDLTISSEGTLPDLGPGGRLFVEDLREVTGLEVTEAFAVAALAMWAWLHGLVSLEVVGQFHWIYPDGAGLLFDAALVQRLDELGWDA